MSPMDHKNTERGGPPPPDRDLLVSRVVDDAASAADWDELRSLAEYDPSVWRELFEAQRAQAELTQAVQQAIAIADEVDAPVEHLPRAGLGLGLRQVASWGGWAVAASVAIFWMAPNLTSQTAAPLAGNQAGVSNPLGGQNTPEAQTPTQRNEYVLGEQSQQPLFGSPTNTQPYLNDPFRMASTQSEVTNRSEPQPLAEMPDRVLLEVRPRADGKLELIYVRRLIERAVVDEHDLYQVKPDDAGIQRTVPYHQRRPSSGPI